MLSRVKSELVFTSFKSTEIYQITTIWSNPNFRGGSFSCVTYQIQSEEKFKDFSVCHFQLWTQECILNFPNNEIYKCFEDKALIVAEQCRDWHSCSSNLEGCAAVTAWLGVEKCTMAVSQMGGDGRDMGGWSSYPPAVRAVWPGKNNLGLYIMHISSLKASCWETGIWKDYMGKIIAFLLSYLPPRTTRNVHKKQDAGNPNQAGSEGMLF